MRIRLAAVAVAGTVALATGMLTASGAAAAQARSGAAAQASPAQVTPDVVTCANGPRPVYWNVYGYSFLMNAQGFNNPANIIVYPPVFDSNKVLEANEIWRVCQLTNGYDAIMADYNGNLMCLNVKGAVYQAGTPLLAWPCNNTVTANEQFREPQNTLDPYYSLGYYIVPAGNYNLCLNVQGGVGAGHAVILWPCNNQVNEAWTPVPYP